MAAADEGVGDGVEDDADDVEGDGLLQVRLRGDGAEMLGPDLVDFVSRRFPNRP